jgi:cell division protein FtsW (lipid II flippase)
MQNYPTNIPANYYSSSPPPVQKKERGVLLTVVMAIATVWNVIATFGIVLGGAAIDRAAAQSADDLGSTNLHHTLSRLVAVLAVFQVAQLISVLGMWAWKRWALMGYFLTSIFAILGFMKMTGETPIWSMLWLGVVLIGVFPRLAMFED